MISLVRPAARPDFAPKARTHLDALRAITVDGTSIDGSHFANREIWRDPKHKRNLVGPETLTKCAWCERHLEPSREFDVEHYRPKAAVTRWEGHPPLVSDDPPKELRLSDGYWWLAFDWGNYSLACKPCNQGWKRNLFPVAEPRPPYREGMEAEEEVLLLDPMTPFCTADHFRWTREGYMEPESAKGEATIITCGLNRAPLVELRRRVADNLLNTIAELGRAAGYQPAMDQHLRMLKALCDPSSEFAGMSRWWVETTCGLGWEELAAAVV